MTFYHSDTTTPPFLSLQNLSFTYPGGETPALEQITASVERGELVLLLGGTGSGKTTLLKLIKQLIAPFGTRTGEIRLAGEEVSRLPKETLAREVGYLFQHTQDQLCMPTSLEEMAFGLRQLGSPPAAISRRCGELSCYFGMENWLDTPIEQLSGGQRQLTALASVLAADPSLLLLDEPTAQLDPVHSRSFLEQLLRLHRDNGMTVLAALHQPESIYFQADRVLVLEQGRLLFSGHPGRNRRLFRGNKSSLVFRPSCRVPGGAGAGVPGVQREGAFEGRRSLPADGNPSARRFS